MSAPIKPSAFLDAAELVTPTFRRSASEIDLSFAVENKTLSYPQPAGSGIAIAIGLGSAIWLALAALAWSLA